MEGLSALEAPRGLLLLTGGSINRVDYLRGPTTSPVAITYFKARKQVAYCGDFCGYPAYKLPHLGATQIMSIHERNYLTWKGLHRFLPSAQ